MSEPPPRPPPPPISATDTLTQHISPPPSGVYHTPPPPPPKPQSPRASGAPYAGISSTPAAPYGASYDQTQYSQFAASGPPPPSAEEGWLPEGLKEQSKVDLETLLADPTLLSALLNAPETAHDSFKASTAHVNTLLTRNITLAQQLDGQAAAVARQREELTSRSLQQRAAERQWHLKQADMDEALAPFSPKALHSRLVGGIAEQEGLLRAMEESFLEEDGKAGEREITDFIKRWREGRKVLALRAERRRRFEEGRVGGWR